MKLKDALELADNNKQLIGQPFNGATIDEIILYPTIINEYNDFAKAYIASGNAQQSILPYLESDLNVGVILNKCEIIKNGVLLYTDIHNIPNFINK